MARRLTRGGEYGVAWPLKEPVSATLNLALSTGGRMFHRRPDGKVEVRFDAVDQRVPRTIHDQVNVDRTASRTTLGMGGSDTLPGFFAGRYAMVPLGFSYRQQIAQQAPEGFDWTVLPAPKGTALDQGVSPQTLSIAEDCPHKEAAMAFIDFLLRPPNMVRLALGDWLLPTGREALKDPALRVARYDWATGTALASSLRSAPAQSVRGYPEWKDKIATLASRSTTAARSAWTRCGSGSSRTAIWSWPGTSADGATRTHHVPAGSGNSRLAKAPGGSRRAAMLARRPSRLTNSP